MQCRKRDFNWCREQIESSRRFFGTEKFSVKPEHSKRRTELSTFVSSCLCVRTFHSASQRDWLSLLQPL